MIMIRLNLQVDSPTHSLRTLKMNIS